MYPKYLESFIVNEKENIYKTHYMLYKNSKILCVVDDDKKFKGVVTFSDISKTYYDNNLELKDIYNKNCKYIIYLNDEDVLMHSRNIFIDYPNINYIPIVDNEKNILDIMSRERAFWKQYYRENKLPRMHYAFAMWNAAFEAKSLGYKEVTVIEFGVAGGSGLLNCEFHAKAISKILDIEIHIYGFDSSNGLPMKNAGYKDMIHIWPGGSYSMNYEELINKLQFSELIIGDINETGKKFFETFNYGPIGCMLIDVDYYSSTLPILDMLNSSDEFFLPRVYMYFDDIAAEYEFSGENLAVSEFNKSHENIKISPEKLSYLDYRMKIKTCHRFNHPKYNDFVTIFLGLELPSDAYELRLKDTL